MRIRNILVFFILFTFNNCKDLYDFKVVRTNNNLVVNGIISNADGPDILKLGTTAILEKEPDPLTGALVSVVDQNGNREYYEDLGEGKYKLNGNTVIGSVNDIYTLEIKLPDGREYRSTPEKMPSPHAKDTAYFKVEKEEIVSGEGVPVKTYKVNIYLTTQFPKTPDAAYIRWGIDEVYLIIPTCAPGAIECPDYCYIYQEVSKYNLKIVNTSNYNELPIKDLLLQSRAVDFTFMQRHAFNITQYAMNQGAYDYWKNVELLTERTGSIFDTPPAALQGNIHNVDDPSEQVFGYFEASATAIIRVFVDRGYIPSDTDVTNCGWDFRYRPSGNPYPYCTSCGAIKGSTNTMPDWFF